MYGAGLRPALRVYPSLVGSRPRNRTQTAAVTVQDTATGPPGMLFAWLYKRLNVIYSG